jgi:DNA-binding helix-turn-helix protein
MKIKINKKLVGLRIKNIRTTLFYTLEEFGNLEGIEAGKSNVSTWERGSSIPNIARLGAISQYGNITINELLYGSIDEFLENNIEVLLMNSKYPYTSIFESYDLKEACLIYIDNINTVEKDKISINDINTIEQAFNEVLDWIISEILEKYNNMKNILTNDKELVKKCCTEYLFTSSDKYLYIFFEKLNKNYFRKDKIEKETMFLGFLDNIDDFTNFFDNDDIKIKVDFFPYLKKLEELIRRELDSYLLPIKVNLVTYPLSRLKDIEILFGENLHSRIDFPQEISSTMVLLKNNKYKIDEFKGVTGVYIESEDTLYYLAHYSRIEDVPLNTEAQYFILNHDNSYFITKITEIPDCKYIAPIIGRLE